MAIANMRAAAARGMLSTSQMSSTSVPSAPLEARWISIPPNVWHQGVVGPEDWAVVSFHTVLEHELIEERPATGTAEHAKQRKYADET
jgi:hypothetical protein